MSMLCHLDRSKLGAVGAKNRAGAAERGQRHRHSGYPRRDYRRTKKTGFPCCPRKDHRSHRDWAGAVRCSQAGRSVAGRPWVDGTTRMPSRRGRDRQAGNDRRDRCGVRRRATHYRQTAGTRRRRRTTLAGRRHGRRLETTPSDPGNETLCSIARKNGVKPPPGYATSGSICRAFLDRHAPKNVGPEVPRLAQCRRVRVSRRAGP